MPAATVTGVQTISLQNINGTSPVTAVKETATVTFSALTEGQTLTLAGLTFTTGTAGATAAQVATAFAGGVAIITNAGGAVGSVLSGTINTYGTTAGVAVNQVVFTQTAAGSPITDLAATGTSTATAPQVSRIALTTNPGNVDNTLTITVNGTSITTIAAAAGANAAGLASLTNDLAAKINGVLGRPAAQSDGISAITLTSATPVAIGGFVASGTTNTTTLSNAPAPRSSTLTFATIPGATTAVTFFLNGISYTTAALAADTVQGYRDAVLARLNEIIPGIATASSTDAILMNNGLTGFTFLKGSSNTGTTVSAAVSSLGVVAATTPAISVVQGVAAVTSTAQLDTVDATKFVGATNFISETSNGDVTFNGLTAAQSVTVNGGIGAVTAAFDATATTATINVSGAHQTGNLTLSSAGGTGLTVVTLNSLGATTAVASTTAALGANGFGAIALGGTTTTLNINAANNLATGNITGFSGTTATISVAGVAGVVNLGTLENTTVQTINASGLTAGGVTVVLNTNATIAFTGGAGVDTVTTGAILTTGTVNAGGGSADVLVVGNVAHVNTAALASKYTGFETLRVGGTMDASLVSGITTVQLTGNGNNISNLSSAQSVVARATTIGATTLAPVSGITNTLNLTMGNSGTAVAAALGGALTLNGYSTLNLTVTPGATVPVSANGAERTTTIDSFTAANLAAINLTGTAAILTNAATGVAVAINGSALIGNGTTGTNAQGLTVAGDLVVGSSVIGSNLRDQFTIGTEAVTYNGGGGNDLFITTVTNLGTGGVTDPTLIGGVGTDTLRISNATVTLADANFKAVTGFEALNLADATGNIKITGLTTNANAAFATGLTVTAGSTVTPMATAKTFEFEGLAYANNVTLTLITNNALLTNAGNVSIITGAGNDTVTVTAAALTGAAGNTDNGSVSISTGSGVDTITVSTGTMTQATGVQMVTITAGTGADIIDVTSHINNGTGAGLGNILFSIAAGDSTTTAYDTITGFKMSDILVDGVRNARISDALDFAGTASIQAYTATAAAGFTAAQLTVAVDGTTGVATLAGTSAATLSLADTISAIQSVVTLANGNTALFTYAVAGITSSFVFNNNSTADSVVQLVGVSGLTLLTTNSVTADNGIFIA